MWRAHYSSRCLYKCSVQYDKMNLVGYLVTLANLQSFQGSGGPLKDLSIKVSNVESLAEELRNQSQFSLECFRENGFCRVGNVGKYISKHVRDYMYGGQANVNDEGVLLTLYFTDKPSSTAVLNRADDESLSYFLHRADVNEDVMDNINDYLGSMHVNARDKRSILDRMIRP